MSPEQEKIRKLESVNEALIRQIRWMMRMMTNKSESDICNFIHEVVEGAEKCS